MGIINLTPDSFSDGGKFNSQKKALSLAKKMEKEGADILDIGGESTGPGSKKVSEKEELKRVISTIKAIRKITKLPISIDTYKAKVAEEALKAGANIINDVTAFRGDKRMANVVKNYGCPIIIMFSKDNTPRTTVKNKKYPDVIKTIKTFLKKQIKYAKSKGINPKQIIIDPGMGQFLSAIPSYSLEIIARLYELKKLNHKILIGISRKSFLGGTMKEREKKALPLSGVAYLNGASILRTHNVKETTEFFKNFK